MDKENIFGNISDLREMNTERQRTKASQYVGVATDFCSCLKKKSV